MPLGKPQKIKPFFSGPATKGGGGGKGLFTNFTFFEAREKKILQNDLANKLEGGKALVALKKNFIFLRLSLLTYTEGYPPHCFVVGSLSCMV